MNLELAKTHFTMEEYNKNRKYKMKEKRRREEEEEGEGRREEQERRLRTNFASLFSHNLSDLKYEDPKLFLNPN